MRPERSRPPRRLASVPDDPAAAPPAAEGDAGDGEDAAATRMWHVTLSVAGEATSLPELRRALETLVDEHPPLMTSRYAADHAEIRYWEEAAELQDAAALALRLWGEYRVRVGLPPWRTVGLEVVDRRTYRQRVSEGHVPPSLAAGAQVRPF